MIRWHDGGQEAIAFDDVLLRPAYSELDSRADAETNLELGLPCYKHLVPVQPIMPANMMTIATKAMISTMVDENIIVPAHRFQTAQEEIDSLHSKMFPKAASVGIKEEERLDLLAPHVQIIFLELAHAHTKQAINEAKRIVRNYPGRLLVAGNVATADACKALADAGVQICKIGIGPGAVCSTRIVTGTGVPQLSAILECAATGIPIIADGGIRNSGDCVKALAAGASFVMIGSLFAGTDEAGTQRIKGDGTKIFIGMASQEAGRVTKGNVPEGVTAKVPYAGSARDVANDLLAGIRQGMAMVGARNVRELREKAVFQRVSQATLVENQPHILFRR